MLNLKEKIILACMVVAILAGLACLVSSLNKKMVASCVAGGHSVDYCKFQVMR